MSVLDGLTLSWLVDRDGAAAHVVLDAFADHLTCLVGTGHQHAGRCGS